jgi:hypothetical protein
VITPRSLTVCLLDSCIREWLVIWRNTTLRLPKKATGKQCTVVRVLDPVRFTTRTSNESHQRYC